MKKKFFVLCLLACCAAGSVACAKDRGGFIDRSAAVADGPVTVAEAKALRDDAWVVMRGHIVAHLFKDSYTFRDDTGDIRVKIDNDNWHGLTVGPSDLVEVEGKIDIDHNELKVDVKRIHAFATRKEAAHPANASGSKYTTVDSIKNAPRDEKFVVVRGRIAERIHDEYYTFTDASGSVTVEIDDDDWRRSGVSIGDDVELRGEVEVERRGNVKIDVDSLSKVR